MRTLEDLGEDIAGKKVLMRVDFNVPMDRKTRAISNDMRIRKTLPTIRHVIGLRARTILMSHLGRPDGKSVPELSLRRVADRLSGLLGVDVGFAPDCIGPEARAAVDGLVDGEVLMLENVRFHGEEEENDPAFVQELAALGDVYVNDAFGTAQRAHASTEGVARVLPSYAGYLIEKEVQYLSQATQDPGRPFVAIMGGAKVSDKIGAIRNLLTKADVLLVGGAMAYTFLKAQGRSVGNSKVEEDKIDVARDLLTEAGDRIMLPVDHVCAKSPDTPETATTTGIDVPDGLMGLDIGRATTASYVKRISRARLVTWNGPVGYAEVPAFATGTRTIVLAMSECEGTSIVGGGETAEAVEKMGLEDMMDHVSTGGGACLDFLAGKVLPGLAALE